MKPHLEILPKAQKEIYPLLSSLKDMGFVLFGGTAIAMHLGHRESVDFDFFNAKSIKDKIRQIKAIDNIKIDTIITQTDETLTYITDNGVKLSFFGTLEFVDLAKPVLGGDGVLNIADLQSLLATKLKAICDRAEHKDYFDIVCILKNSDLSLRDGLNTLEKFFDLDFPSVNILKHLTYFNDGDLYRLQENDIGFWCKKLQSMKNQFTHI